MACVFIFRRDLRVDDNIAFNRMLRYCKENGVDTIIPIFIFNKKQVDPKLNPYYSNVCVKFMIESLKDLDGRIRKTFSGGLLTFEVGSVEDEPKLLLDIDSRITIKGVFFNRDVTPFAIKRDELIIKVCKDNGWYHIDDWLDYTLFDVTSMEKGYRIYGPFLKKYMELKEVAKPYSVSHNVSVSKSRGLKISSVKDWDQYYKDDGNGGRFKGGREYALKRFEYIKENRGTFAEYDTNRNFPYLDENSTTLLSSYIKFGCVSIREVYWLVRGILGEGSGILRELYWRTFYDQMVYWWPETLDRQRNVAGGVKNQAWFPLKDGPWAKNERTLFNIVIDGRCGIPIVDASIACVKATGYLHNRLRMVLCMTACRILRINWRTMEQWFAQVLVDYHPASNRGGWEWALTYQYVLNPWVQQAKFDTECVFIKKWLPGFGKLEPKIIHEWYNTSELYKNIHARPIVDRKLNVVSK